MTQNIPGVPLGVATAILEVDLTQLTRGERALTATIQNIAKAQQMLLQGDQALQASAKTTLGLLERQQRTTKGQQVTAAKQETAELRNQAALTETIVRTEQTRVNVARQTTQALEQQTRQLQQQGAIADRLAAAARIRQASESSQSFTGQLRQDAFGGGLPQAAGGARRGGGGGFGAGNPNIPTFAQFGLFPFAGLAGAAGAPGLQQGILGASSVLGIAELGSFRNAITRLGTQLQGLGGLFGNLASGGARAAQALGAQSGGLVSSLGAIVGAAAPLVGLIGGLVLLGKALEDLQKGVDLAVENINRRSEQIAQGSTSREIGQGVREQQTQLDARRAAADTLRTIFEDQRGNVNLDPEAEQRVESITGTQLGTSAFGSLAELRGIIEQLDGQASELSSSIAADTATMNSAEIAANDAAEATSRLARAQAEAAEEARGLTNSQINDKLGDLRGELSGLVQQLAGNVSISNDYRQELVDQILEIRAQIDAYEGLKSPLRDFLIGLQQLPDFLKGSVDFLKNLAERREDLGRTLERQAEDEVLQDARQQEDQNRQRLRALEDFGRETRQAEEQYQTQRQRVIDDAARADAELVEEAAIRRQELIDEANEKELEAEEEHQNRIAKILRDGRTRILEAAARLDARGVLETQRRLRDQIQEENERRTEAREDAQEKLAEQLADLDANLEEQRRRRAEDLQRRLQDMATEFAITQQRRRDDFNRRLLQEDQERAFQAAREAQDRLLRRQRQLADFARETNDQLQHYTNLAQIQRNGLDFLRQGFQNFFTAAQQQQAGFAGYGTGVYGGAFLGARGGGSGGGTGAFRTRTFASGISRVPQDMLAGLHAGERVLTPLQAAQQDRGGGRTVVVNINGDLGNNAAPAVRDAAEQGVDAAMERWMWNFIGESMDDLGNM